VFRYRTALLVAALLAAWRLGQTVLKRRHVKFVRDANVAIGHQLQRISTGANRVFHDVETSAGIVDHVLVGQTGIYAVNVVARRGGRNGSAALANSHIRFSGSDEKMPIVDIAASTARLEKEVCRLLGHKKPAIAADLDRGQDCLRIDVGDRAAHAVRGVVDDDIWFAEIAFHRGEQIGDRDRIEGHGHVEDLGHLGGRDRAHPALRLVVLSPR